MPINSMAMMSMSLRVAGRDILMVTQTSLTGLRYHTRRSLLMTSTGVMRFNTFQRVTGSINM
jgi:hypothetical protein